MQSANRQLDARLLRSSLHFCSTIFYTQREVAKRMNVPVEQQHKMIENKRERDQGAGILSLIPVQRKIFW